MYKLRFLVGMIALSSAVCAWAQANPEGAQASVNEQLAAMNAKIEQQPTAQSLSQMLNSLGNLSKAGDDKKAEAKQLAADAATAQKAGNNGEARRRLSRAITLLSGGTWNEAQEFGSSLVFRADLLVADLNTPFLFSLSQTYPAHYVPNGALQLRLSIAEAAPRIANDVPFIVAANGKGPQPLATFAIPNRDLIDEPMRLSTDLKAVGEGSYLLLADLYDGDTVVARRVTPVYLVKDIQARRQAIASKSVKIKGSPNSSVMTTIRYPFELADNMNTQRFELTSFDFAGQIKRSEQLMNGLASGKDPLTRAKGDAKRNYWFAEANEIMPYRLYVPKSWDAKKKLPMIVALHGSGLDENNMLDRGDGIVVKLAEQHGYIVASPLAYHSNGGAPQARTRELGDQDVMNVMEIVAAEYGVDRSRIYMMGNSAGAGRTWSLASRYGEKFAGLAPCASGTSLKDLSFEKFKNMPVLACVGELDTTNRKEVGKFGIAKVKEVSAHAEYVEVPGGTHGTGIQIAMPQIFEFFNRYTRTP